MSLTNNPAISQELNDVLNDPELFSALNRHFGCFIGRLAKNYRNTAALSGALVSRITSEGNVCLELADFAGRPLCREAADRDRSSYACPSLDDWVNQLEESGVVGRDEDVTPLVLIKSRLYLRRYREYEKCIISFIRQRGEIIYRDLDYPLLKKELKRLFEATPAGEQDWQQVATIAALRSSFCVISGGPGTGKTFTVAKILALLNRRYQGKKLRILLAAPTGKAAAKLQESIIASGLDTGTEQLQAATLHRLLGHVTNSPYFRYNSENPLEADIIVIDEASMVDLPLMAKLLQAVPASARLILLGDRHQLASVQPGSVLGDICNSEAMTGFSQEFRNCVRELAGISIYPASDQGTAKISSSIQDSLVELDHSYRFDPKSSIARLSQAVKDGDSDRALAILKNSTDGSTAWTEIPDPADLGRALQNSAGLDYFSQMQQARDPQSCFEILDNFRLLCGLRRGPYGADRINRILEQLFSQAAKVGPNRQAAGPSEDKSISLRVRPVMVTRNDYNLQLFNGDVGIIMPEPEPPHTQKGFFRAAGDTLRNIAPPLLPEHETVFAMTVHKSQGSEFNRLLFILPDRDSPLLTRELIYTALTRAREKVEIWGRKEVFAAAINRKIKRTSGLRQGLWNDE